MENISIEQFELPSNAGTRVTVSVAIHHDPPCYSWLFIGPSGCRAAVTTEDDDTGLERLVGEARNAGADASARTIDDILLELELIEARRQRRRKR